MSKKTMICGKEIVFYPARAGSRPLVLLNNFSGDGQSVHDALQELGVPDLNLCSIGRLTWDHDMTPWYAPPLSADDTPCTGGADAYLLELTQEILPHVLEMTEGSPPFTAIAGYSLAGLFALYALYHTDAFDRAASMSGSLWFPDFVPYAKEHAFRKNPDKLYLSLGDKEASTRNPVLKTVQENTEELVAHYREQGIATDYELNPGNHFKDAALRTAKGIAAIL